MDAQRGLIPRPTHGCSHIAIPAGLARPLIGNPVQTRPEALRPGASPVYPVLLSLLETMRTLVLSGQEPASFLIAITSNGRQIMAASEKPAQELDRLVNEYGTLSMAFAVSARATAEGTWLTASELTGRSGHRLEQFCRRNRSGRYEPLPHCWSPESRNNAVSRHP